MKPRFVAYLSALALLVSLISVSAASPAVAVSGITRQIALAGTGSPVTGEFVASSGELGPQEFRATPEEHVAPTFDGTIAPSITRGAGSGGATSNPQINTSFEGLNHYQQRYSRGGNQFSVEPPDQGMCVGNGYVLEAVNDVMNVFNYSGASVLPDNTSTNIVAGSPRNVNHAVDLNSFYGYPPAINRTTFISGQFVTDPSCLYDSQTQRFFVVVLTLETDPATGAFTTENHLDIAVSVSSNPTLGWKIYRVDVTNDGTNAGGVNPCPCLGDYPHIGADANGFYVTTNSYPWCCNGFDGAQIYAFSKRQLAAGALSVKMTHIDTWGAVNVPSDAGSTQPGFTVWPSVSASVGDEVGQNGTEFFMSSNAADEATHPVAGTGGNYVSNKIVVWSLSNTKSLDRATPQLNLTNKVIQVNTYAIPDRAEQRGSGSAPTPATPQGYCLNNETTVTTLAGTGCWRLLTTATRHARGAEVVSGIDSNDTRMQQVMFAKGKLWGALGTDVMVGGSHRAGIAYFIVNVDDQSGGLKASVALQGTYGAAGRNLLYPAVGVNAAGKGVVAFTVAGPNDFPSAGYASIDAANGIGAVQIAAAGVATQDGFTGYKQQSRTGAIRPRWGDYGAAAVDGNSIWIASEYIAHECNYDDWLGPFKAGGSGDNLLGTCAGASRGPGGRSALANWSTRITKITP